MDHAAAKGRIGAKGHMKYHHGDSYGIDSDLVGKVTSIRQDHHGNPVVIVSTKDSDLVLSSHQNGRRKRGVSGISTLSSFSVGDILLLMADGTVVVEYARGSNDNSLFITDKCNCDCICCPQPRRTSKSYLQINKSIVDLLNYDVDVLGMTGGEPTVEYKELLEIIRYSKERLPNIKLQLLTNGIALNDKDKVKEIVRLGKQSVSFHIPLFADTPSIHNAITITEGFYPTIDALYNIASMCQSIEIRIVILAQNADRLPNIAEFIYNNFPFTQHVAFMGLEPIGQALDNIESLWVDPADITKELIKAVKYLIRADMSVSLYNFPLCVLPICLHPYARKSISDWKKILLDNCQNCAKRFSCSGLFMSQSEGFRSRLVGSVY